MADQLNFASDWHRPTYHFLPSANWMNDPNGLIQWKGTYHLFYQYNPHGAFHATMHWGHAMSEDLMRWRHLPIALAPSPDGPDADGIFSGCAVDVDGVPTLLYTGVRGQAQLPCIATSEDDDLATWTKDPGNPVIASPPAELETTIFRDHTVWQEGDTWYQAIGSGVQEVGGTAVVYRSADFRNWDFVGSLVALDRVTEGVGAGATGWECPDFFALAGRHVLVVSMWDHRAISVSYFVGTYRDNQFVPERQGLVEPGMTFYAPQSFTDDRGRRIMFGWLKEGRGVEAQIAAGWSGVMSLPRVLSILADGSLGTAPAPEVDTLRGTHISFAGNQLADGQQLPLGEIPGDALEIGISLRPDVSGTVTLEVLKSPDGGETTLVTYDAATQTLAVDTRASSRAEDITGDVSSLRYPGAMGRDVDLRVFVDHSVIEVFLNGEKSITARAYPTSADSTGVHLTADDGFTSLQRVDVWAMAP